MKEPVAGGYDLATLALRAAMELERLAREDNPTTAFRQTLAQRFRNEIARTPDTSRIKIALSPSATKIVASALSPLHDTHDMNGLYHAIQDFSDSLEKIESVDKPKISMIKEMCLQLHKQLINDAKIARQQRRAPYRHNI